MLEETPVQTRTIEQNEKVMEYLFKIGVLDQIIQAIAVFKKYSDSEDEKLKIAMKTELETAIKTIVSDIPNRVKSPEYQGHFILRILQNSYPELNLFLTADKN